MTEKINMTEAEMIEDIAKTIGELEDAVKPSKKELAKLFVSGFVGGCSGTLVATWITPLKITFGGPKVIDTVINKVGVYGLTGLVVNKVMRDTKEELDAVDDLIKIQKTRRKAKKVLAEARKATKQKYVEAIEEK